MGGYATTLTLSLTSPFKGEGMRFFPFTLCRVRMTIGLWREVASPLCGDELKGTWNKGVGWVE